MSPSTIFILHLQHGKYYVGNSRNPLFEFEQHLLGNVCEWTKFHKPLEMIKVIENVSYLDEDNYVKQCMFIYGIDNVRGGSYKDMELTESQKYILSREMMDEQNRSFDFDDDDSINYDSDISTELWVCDYCDTEFESEQDSSRHEMKCETRNQTCDRCGRVGHSKLGCYANTDVYGKLIC
jgi:hypothetical protein